MDILKINYKNESGGEGEMRLNCDSFFPCTKAKAKIVFSLAIQNCSSETIQELKKHLIGCKKSSEDAWKAYSKKYLESSQKASDILQLIATGKHPIGMRLTREELCKVRNDLIQMKAESRYNLAEVKKNRRASSKYFENIEFLEQCIAKQGV